MKTLTKTLAILITLTAIGFTSCQMTEDVLPDGGGRTENPINPGGGNNNDDGNNSGNEDNNGNGNNSGNDDKIGDSKGLHSDVPVISGLNFLSSFECNGGEKRIYKNSSNDYHATIEAYVRALQNAGFTRINSTLGGGWGPYGGRQAWGYKGSKYVKINAQVQEDKGSVVYVCAWSSKPADDNCDEDCD